jgi:hypothetical protein
MSQNARVSSRHGWARALALCLIIGLTFLAFEAGLHSTHHDDAEAAAACPVALVCDHVSGLTTTAAVLVIVSLLLVARVVGDSRAVRLLRSRRPDRDRAPPVAGLLFAQFAPTT